MITITFNDYYYIQLTLLDILEVSLKLIGILRLVKQRTAGLSPFNRRSGLIVTFYQRLIQI